MDHGKHLSSSRRHLAASHCYALRRTRMTATVRRASSFHTNHHVHLPPSPPPDPDEILRLQGVPWMKRKIISSITVTLYTKHYFSEDGLEHIDIQQVGSGGFKGNFEPRVLDWTERERNDGLFGQIVGKSRHLKVEDIEDEWQREGWSDDTLEHGVIESLVWSNTPKSGKVWTADQVRFMIFSASCLTSKIRYGDSW